MIGLPKTTEVNKRIPKQKFYENMDISPALKKVFVEQVRIIYWKNKIAASTTNLAAGTDVTELEVFEVRLSSPILDDSLLRQIDKEIPYKTLQFCEGHPLKDVYYELADDFKEKSKEDLLEINRMFEIRRDSEGINCVCFEGYPNTGAFVIFEEQIKLPSIPEGWEYRDDNSVRWDCELYTNPTDYYKKLIRAILFLGASSDNLYHELEYVLLKKKKTMRNDRYLTVFFFMLDFFAYLWLSYEQPCLCSCINDMYAESRNDDCKYAELATQEDFDKF